MNKISLNKIFASLIIAGSILATGCAGNHNVQQELSPEFIAKEDAYAAKLRGNSYSVIENKTGSVVFSECYDPQWLNGQAKVFCHLVDLENESVFQEWYFSSAEFSIIENK